MSLVILRNLRIEIQNLSRILYLAKISTNKVCGTARSETVNNVLYDISKIKLCI